MTAWPLLLVLAQPAFEPAPVPPPPPAEPAEARPANAAEPADPNQVVIIGGRNPARIPVDRFRDVQKAFRKYRPRYAPDATLTFFVVASDGGAPRDLELRLEGQGDTLVVPIAADGSFTLPVFEDDDWRLTSNRPERAFGILAKVFSPGSTEGDWRLGDLQLQCRVSWQLARQETNFALAGLFDAIGGCTSSRVAIYYQLSRPVASARIVGGERSQELEVSKRSLRLPSHLKDYEGDARVTVTFADGAPAS